MARKNVLVYFLIVLILGYPASAAPEASLNKWVLNVTLQDDGSIEEVIQTEIENSGTTPIEGLSFVVPSSEVSITEDQIMSIPALGQVVEQQAVANGMKIIIRFNKPLETGKKWDGRITLSAPKWAVKNEMNYIITIPVKAPQIIVGGKEIDIKTVVGGEIRAQVFFPEGIEIKSVTQTPEQRPYKKLFQYNKEVLTWFTDNLQIDDTIKIEGSFSEVLSKIVETNEKISAVSSSIKKANGQGIDVSDAEAHFKNAEEYLNTALGSFWKGESENAMTYIGYANDEIEQAESSLATPAGTSEPTQTPEAKKNPGFEVFAAAAAIGLILCFMRKK